jgi:hypothetical protein
VLGATEQNILNLVDWVVCNLDLAIVPSIPEPVQRDVRIIY